MLEEVLVHAPARLADQMQAHDAGRIKSTEVVTLEDVQDALHDRRAGRSGYADDVDTAITPAQPIVVSPRLVCGEILLEQNSAVRAHVRRERLRDVPPVEHIRPELRDQAKGLPEVALHDAIGHGEKRARTRGTAPLLRKISAARGNRVMTPRSRPRMRLVYQSASNPSDASAMAGS